MNKYIVFKDDNSIETLGLNSAYCANVKYRICNENGISYTLTYKDRENGVIYNYIIPKVFENNIFYIGTIETID